MTGHEWNYARRYLITAEWGGGVVFSLKILTGVPDGLVAVSRQRGGTILMVPEAALTPVEEAPSDDDR